MPQKEMDRIHFYGEKLLKWKKENAHGLPICLADVPNITFGRPTTGTFLSNRRLLRIFLDKLLADFCAVGLVSKFALPYDLAQQVSQLNRVLYFQTFKTQ